jgi:hypothetical protein
MNFPPGTKRAPPSVLHYVHVRSELALVGASDEAVLEDINRLIGERGGIVLANGQILVSPLSPDWILDRHYEDETTSDWDHPIKIWGEAQQASFESLLGVGHPFQYGEDRTAYGRYCITVSVPGPYLAPDERILGLVDAGMDEQNYYCPCHYAEVVVTSAHRLVCMVCGYMHCALTAPLAKTGQHGWSEDDWHQSFDSNGVLVSGDLRVPFIEYREIFAADKLWTCDAWEAVSSEIEFLERGDPEEVARWRAGQPTAEDFMEAGFSAVPQPPTPARQMEIDGFGVDIGENAAQSLHEAARHYAGSGINPAEIRSAILDLFQAIELLLKIKLESLTGDPAGRKKTNPQVLQALADLGSPLSADDSKLVIELRAMRNKLQHSGARYGYADARAMIERSFVFVDRFARDSIGWWIGEVIEQPAWDVLLLLEPIRQSAVRRAEELVAQWRAEDGLNGVETCPHCSRETVLRERSRAGFCVYCRRLPVRT